MGALADLERFLERLFERPASRLFGGHLQPIHLQRRIERAMETERATGADRTYAPNVFRLSLHPGDLAALEPVADSLALELADAALAFARAHHLVLTDRPRVELVEDPAVVAGDVRVRTGFSGPGGSRAGVDGRSGLSAPNAHAERLAGRIADQSADGGGPTDEAAGSEATHDRGESGPTRARPDAIPGPNTMVFEVPVVRVPQASLRITGPDGVEHRIAIRSASMTIGRSPDAEVRLDDRRVSRRHARLQVRRGVLVLQDLGSTNGTRVNGLRVDEVALGDGDRIELGESAIVVEQHGPP